MCHLTDLLSQLRKQHSKVQQLTFAKDKIKDLHMGGLFNSVSLSGD
ncbi:hypothetical protein THOD04_200024 [Vibrio owensii]|nr:hypothetical protein THOD04_200024 [Vibrio owensii]